MSVVSDSKSPLTHVPVLARDVPEVLIGNRDGVYVDATFGRGGHTRLVLKHLGGKARLFAFDRDRQAVASAVSLIDSRFTMIASAFSNMKEKLAGFGIEKVDGILMDLGISSPQIDDPARGFSFRADGPLDMRMDQTCGRTRAYPNRFARVRRGTVRQGHCPSHCQRAGKRADSINRYFGAPCGKDNPEKLARRLPAPGHTHISSHSHCRKR